MKKLSKGGFRWRGLMVDVFKYNNTTNYRGSKFLTSNIWLGPLKLFVKLCWFQWPEFGDSDREVEVEYLFPIRGRQRSFRVRLLWKADL